MRAKTIDNLLYYLWVTYRILCDIKHFRHLFRKRMQREAIKRLLLSYTTQEGKTYKDADLNTRKEKAIE